MTMLQPDVRPVAPEYSILGQPAAHVRMTDDRLTLRTALRLGPGRTVPFRVAGTGTTKATVLSAEVCAIRATGPLYELQVALHDAIVGRDLAQTDLPTPRIEDEGRRASEPRTIAASAGAGTPRETPTSGAKTNWWLAEKVALVAPGREGGAGRRVGR